MPFMSSMTYVMFRMKLHQRTAAHKMGRMKKQKRINRTTLDMNDDPPIFFYALDWDYTIAFGRFVRS